MIKIFSELKEEESGGRKSNYIFLQVMPLYDIREGLLQAAADNVSKCMHCYNCG